LWRHYQETKLLSKESAKERSNKKSAPKAELFALLDSVLALSLMRIDHCLNTELAKQQSTINFHLARHVPYLGSSRAKPQAIRSKTSSYLETTACDGKFHSQPTNENKVVRP
jgi:hypothetical protein